MSFFSYYRLSVVGFSFFPPTFHFLLFSHVSRSSIFCAFPLENIFVMFCLIKWLYLSWPCRGDPSFHHLSHSVYFFSLFFFCLELLDSICVVIRSCNAGMRAHICALRANMLTNYISFFIISALAHFFSVFFMPLSITADLFIYFFLART